MDMKLQKEIDDLFKKLSINKNSTNEKKQNKKLSDYKLKTKFPTKFYNGNLTMSNSTK